MATLSEMMNLAQFQEQQRRPQPVADLGAQIQAISQQITERDRKRKQKETQQRLRDVIRKETEAGEIVPEYDVSAEGDISIKYKQPATKYEFTNAINKAAERIKAGEDFSEVVLELETDYPKQYNTMIEKHLRKITGAEEEKDIFTKSHTEKVLGELESGGASTAYGMVIKFGSREDMVNHALREFGPNWQEVEPRAIDIIDRKWPIEGGETPKGQEISLPETIKTTSQALKYLMESHNMTKEQATEWLRSQ